MAATSAGRTVTVRLAADVNSFIAAMAKASAATQSMASSLAKASQTQSWKTVSSDLLKVGAAATAVAGFAAKAAMEFGLIREAETSLTLLRDKIQPHVESKYDYVMLDCPPNLGFWTMSALITANLVISPTVSGSGFSLDGLLRTIKLIQEIQQEANPSLRFFRLLINNVDKRTTMGKVTLAQLMDKLGKDMIFATTIPTSSQFQQAEHMRETVLRQNPKGPAAKAYRALAQEVLDLVGG